METSSSSPHPATDLSTPLYYHLVSTLTDLLPPPLDDSPEALRARTLAAIAKVAALLPANANEADLAAQCIAARAQAEEMLRLLRQHADDIGMVIRLNAQYGSMVRTSLSVHGRLMRVQALRHKREATGAAVNADAWAQHVAEQSMLEVVDPESELPEAALPKPAPIKPAPIKPAPPKLAPPKPAPPKPAPPKPAPIEAPAAKTDQPATDIVSETATSSQQTAFETWLSEQPWSATGSGETDLSKLLRQALTKSRLAKSRLNAAGRASPQNGRESPGSAD